MFRWLPIASLLVLVTAVLAVPPTDPTAKPQPNPDAEQALAKVKVDPGLKVSLWATEPLFANPVAFAFDEKGQVFVSETTRIHKGVPDTRGHMYWLDEDLACRTVEDRLAMYKKHKFQGYEKYHDQVRKVWDSNGDGVADQSAVFSTGYNQPADGVASGVLARKGDVYFTNIPGLYRLRDADGDHKAESKTTLSTGYGVRFIGHDLHGLRMGPDGKLYFSIGDRGLHVVTQEGHTLANPDSGCVLRCHPDGSALEIVHIGLRNPQELAFDNFGNLFTYDNNCDSGDRARWVQIVEGGDSGWRAGYQYGTFVHHDKVPQGNRGPWNTETIWHVPHDDVRPPAYVVPPLAHFGNGPSGITHYPGIGLHDRYRDHFFACDFTGGSGGSVIWSLGLKPKGASFEVVDLHPFVRQMLPTDCEFGPDGAFYWSDWTSGWDPNDKGRIFRLTDPEAMKNPAVAEAQTILAVGFEKRGIPELAKLLGHPHQLVRQEAQYELAGRNKQDAIPALCQVAQDSQNTLARLHAIWGLGMIDSIRGTLGSQTIAKLVRDSEPSVRAAAVQVMGQRAFDGNLQDPLHASTAIKTVATVLKDDNAHVRAAAARAYGRIGQQFSAFSSHTPRDLSLSLAVPLWELLQANADHDVYIRQAAVHGLCQYHSRSADLFASWERARDQYNTPAVRLGVVLALRRRAGPELAHFLNDENAQVVAEAARAIYAENVTAALPQLAELAAKPGLADPVAYRALAANYRLGTPTHAARVAAFAARTTEADHLRICALKLLANWAKPPRRDPIHGLVHDLPPRDAAAIAQAIEPMLSGLFAGSDAVRSEAVKMVQALNVMGVTPLMMGLVQDKARPANMRAEALFALSALKAKELSTAIAFALKTDAPKLRAAARVIQAQSDVKAARKTVPAQLDDPKLSVIEKQMLFAVLGTLPESENVDQSLARWLDRLQIGQVPPELQLDILEAAQKRIQTPKLKLHTDLKAKLNVIEKAARQAEAQDPLARSRDTLYGGDAERGRSIFLNNSAVYCQRCHKLDGQGGEVGPPLNGIAKDKNREYLLTAILKPNAAIAKGYESVLLNTIDGKVITGVLRAKTAESYTVITGEGKTIVVPTDDVDSVRPDKSAMPDDLAKKLSPRELRDLVEFLSALKQPLPR
ncbi:MAG: HEAT repeat domain-containing protein [Bacteroidales bacterium]|nr:HEAT repeat domain-containing protein [Bacteroidales bacterium]